MGGCEKWSGDVGEVEWVDVGEVEWVDVGEVEWVGCRRSRVG